jgi:hypothetical protein
MKHLLNIRSRSNLLICFVLLLTSFVAISTLAAAEKEAKRHTGKNRRAVHFSIKLGKGWNEAPNKLLEWSKPGSGSIGVSFAVDKTEPEKIRDQLIEALPKQIKSWKKTEDEIDEIDEKPYLKLASTFEVDGPKGKISVAQIQYYIHFNGEKYYIVTFTCPAEKFEDMQEEFEEAAESIQID